ncbi:MAG: hypothetical protein M3179_11240 [Actinomycetota bacterium]|nr:hypothetical protein [Actinomycetota bacterium]
MAIGTTLANYRQKLSPLTVVVGVILGVAIAFAPVVVAVVGPMMLSVLLLGTLVRVVSNHDSVADRRILGWTMSSFFLHLAVGMIITYAGGVITSYLAAPDANLYDAWARRLVDHWNLGLPIPDIPAGKQGYYYLLAAIYWVFGPHRVAGLIVNAALAAAIVPLLTDTTRRLFGDGPARYVAPLVVFLPSLVLWPSLPIKEAAVVFLAVFALNCAVRVTERISLGALFGMAVCLSLLFTFRAWVALVLAAGVTAGVALGRGRLLSGLGSGIGGATLLAVLLAAGLGYSGYQTAVNADLEEANLVRRDLATAGSGFDQEADVSTPQAALSYLPQGLPKFLFGPFPWQITGPRQLPVVPDMIVWWALLPSLWVGIRTGLKRARRRALVLLLPALLSAILLSLAVGNFGTVVRERVQVIVLIVPVIALGLSERAARRSRPPASENGAPAPSLVAVGGIQLSVAGPVPDLRRHKMRQWP